MKRRKKKKNRAIKFLFKLLLLVAVIFLALPVINQLDFSSIEFPKFEKTAKLDNGWNLILVNSEYKVPKNLDIEFMELNNGEKVDSRIYPELQQMFDDMRAQGLTPVVASGYRTAEYQQELLNEKIDSLLAEGYSESAAKTEAETWIAEPGHSEHHTGLAIDINSGDDGSTTQQMYDWLACNAWQYGFIYRYPADKTEITKISPEPWHYRYVGRDTAEIIYEQGLSLEEYIDLYC